MDFDLTKVKAYYDALVQAREEAIAKALANKDVILEAKVEEAKAKILETLESDLIAEAEAPYVEELKRFESFKIDEPATETFTENVEQ